MDKKVMVVGYSGSGISTLLHQALTHSIANNIATESEHENSNDQINDPNVTRIINAIRSASEKVYYPFVQVSGYKKRINNRQKLYKKRKALGRSL